MDPQRFDAMARMFAECSTRRRVLVSLSAAALALLERGTNARTCTGPGTICREDATCCSGACGPKDASGRRRCVCVAPSVACDGRCVDPANAFKNDPANCGACGNTCPKSSCRKAICTEGTCDTVPNSAAVGKTCDDGNRCTVNDVCGTDGTCTGTAVTCPECQVCDVNSGSCVVAADGTPCGDGKTCCGGSCRITSFDSENCVTCGTVCPANQICSAGCCIPIIGGCDPSGPDLCCHTSVCGANSKCCQPSGYSGPVGGFSGPTPYCCSGQSSDGTCV